MVCLGSSFMAILPIKLLQVLDVSVLGSVSSLALIDNLLLSCYIYTIDFCINPRNCFLDGVLYCKPEVVAQLFDKTRKLIS